MPSADLIFLGFQEYFKLYPEGFRPEDVYVCESRYSAKSKSFKKIKLWAMPLSSVRFVPREVPLPVVRVASMFAPKQEEKPAEIVDEGKMTDGTLEKVGSNLVGSVKITSGHRSNSACKPFLSTGEGGRSTGCDQWGARLSVL